MELPAYAPTLYVPQSKPFAPPSAKAAHVARVKSSLLRAAHTTLDAEGFTQVVAPILTTLSGACGEPGTLIPVDLPDRQAYLRQTSQLHLEPLMRELGRVYSIGKSFRAERRDDERHLIEFTLLEAEAAAMTLYKTMALMERLVGNMLRSAMQSSAPDLDALGVDPDDMMAWCPGRSAVRRMTYDEAIVALQDMGCFVEWGEDLSNKHELALTMMVVRPAVITLTL